MKNNHHEAKVVSLKKTTVYRMLLLIFIFCVIFTSSLTGCASNSDTNNNSQTSEPYETNQSGSISEPTTHVCNWDYSVKGEIITVSYELQSVMTSGANGEMYEIYVYCYFRTVDGWEYGTDSYRYKIFPVIEGKTFETWEFYDEDISIEYITEGTPRYEAQKKVVCYCPDCGKYRIYDNSYNRKIYIPEGTFFIVNN